MWKNLRDSFASKLRRIKAGKSGDGLQDVQDANAAKKWAFFDQMMFLADTLSFRKYVKVKLIASLLCNTLKCSFLHFSEYQQIMKKKLVMRTRTSLEHGEHQNRENFSSLSFSSR